METKKNKKYIEEHVEEHVKTITKAELKRRGWTESMITKYLGDPYDTKKVSGYKYPFCLYKLSDVENIEQTEEFIKRQAKNDERHQERSAIMKKVAEKRIQKLADFVGIENIKITKLAQDKLERKAINSFNEWKIYNENYDGVISESIKDLDKPFLERICVNYIRHNLTNYDSILMDIDKQFGSQTIYTRLLPFLYQKIADTYPHLANECTRQLNEKNFLRSMAELHKN